jgi:hypothetical protein
VGAFGALFSKVLTVKVFQDSSIEPLSINEMLDG